MTLPPLMKLDQQTRKFIFLYLGEAEGNAQEAAIGAGYHNPKVAGYRLLNQPDIQLAIEEKLALGGSICTRHERLMFLTNVMRGEVLDFNQKGEEINCRIKDRVEAVKLISQMQGDFAPQEHNVNVRTWVDIMGTIDVESRECLPTEMNNDLPRLLGTPSGGSPTSSGTTPGSDSKTSSEAYEITDEQQ